MGLATVDARIADQRQRQHELQQKRQELTEALSTAIVDGTGTDPLHEALNRVERELDAMPSVFEALDAKRHEAVKEEKIAAYRDLQHKFAASKAVEDDLLPQIEALREQLRPLEARLRTERNRQHMLDHHMRELHAELVGKFRVSLK